MRAPIASLGQNVSDLPGSAGLEALRHAAQHKDPAAAKVTASKFEGLLAEQLVKNMRQTSMGDSMFPGSSSLYREMYDKEIAKRLTQGKGLGLQPMIRRALGDKSALATPNAAANSATAMSHAAFSLAKYTKSQAVAMPLAIAPPGVVNSAAPAPQSPTPPQNAPAPASAAAPWLPSLTAQPADLAATRLAPTPALAPIETKAARTPAVSSPGSGRPATGTGAVAATFPHGALNRATGLPSNDAFVNAVWPHAQRAAAALGVSPQVLVAQAALESGWGKHVGGDNNLFGIKAGSSWHGATRTLSTSEYENGTLHKESAQFRSYASIGESFDDYAALLKHNPRYAAALNAGPDNAAFAHALQRAGYATDPGYAAKITAIANGPAFAGVLKNSSDAPLIASR